MELDRIIQRFEGDPTGYTAAIDRMIGALAKFMARIGEAERPLDSFESKVVKSVRSASKAMEELQANADAAAKRLGGVEAKGNAAATALRHLRQEAENVRKSMLDLPGHATRSATPLDRFTAFAGSSPEALRRLAATNSEFIKTARLIEQTNARASTPGGGFERQIKNQMALAQDARAATAAEMNLLRQGKFRELAGLPKLPKEPKETSTDSFYRRGAFAGLGSLFAGTAGGLVSSMGLTHAGGGISTGGIAGSLIGSLIAPGLGTIAGAGLGALAGGAIGLPFDVLTKGVGALTSALEQLVSVGSNVTKFAVSTGMEFERLRVTFETMAGSVEKGNQLFRELQGLDVKSPFDLKTLAEASNILLAAGTGPESVVGVLERLQDMAAGSSDRLIHLATDLERVSLTGRITAREMRAFATVGIGIKDLADTMGVTPADIRFMMHQGELGPKVLIDTFNRLTNPGGRFAGMTERFLGTAPGALNQLIETGGQLAGRTAVRAFDRFNVVGGLQGVTSFLNENTETIIQGILSILDRVKVVAEEIWNVFKAIGSTIMGSFSGKTFEQMLPSLDRVREVTRDILDTVLGLGEAFAQLFSSIARHLGQMLSAVAPTLITLFQKYANESEFTGNSSLLGSATGGYGTRSLTPEQMAHNQRVRQSNTEFAEGLKKSVAALREFADALTTPGGVANFFGNLRRNLADERIRSGGFAAFRGFRGTAALQGHSDRFTVEGQPLPGFTPANFGVGNDPFSAGAAGRALVGRGRPTIPFTPEVDQQAVQHANRIIGQLKEQGRDPLEAFQIRMRLINEALNPAQAGADPRLKLEQAKFDRFQAFQELKQRTGITGELHLPPSTLRDSIEAASVIARSQVMKTGEKTPEEIQQEIKQVLEQANDFHERQARAVEATNNILDEMKRNGANIDVLNPAR